MGLGKLMMVRLLGDGGMLIDEEIFGATYTGECFIIGIENRIGV